MAEEKQPIIDWEPAPGFVLIKPVTREEMAALYNRNGASSLSLPDKVGKVSDSVGVGKVVLRGKLAYDANVPMAETAGAMVEDGDYIAFMPYTDLRIEIDGVKYALVEYNKIRAVRKGQ